ncbi:hypothetical protein CABS02_10909 [Colletotrichum abscissum]|uniref:Uncharacterized protein n=1 Tax=Colletotrichum abscissum TaxID=1671311 RepID=A0A9P9X805_9PEZI|nr:hypothetical protein CABS02_10909 [Colletotrichum abscissum]
MERREIFQDATADTKTVDAKTATQQHVQRDEQSQRLETHTSNTPGATAENEANAYRDALRGAPVFSRLEIEMDLLSEGRIRVGGDVPEGQANGPADPCHSSNASSTAPRHSSTILETAEEEEQSRNGKPKPCRSVGRLGKQSFFTSSPSPSPESLSFSWELVAKAGASEPNGSERNQEESQEEGHSMSIIGRLPVELHLAIMKRMNPEEIQPWIRANPDAFREQSKRRHNNSSTAHLLATEYTMPLDEAKWAEIGARVTAAVERCQQRKWAGEESNRLAQRIRSQWEDLKKESARVNELYADLEIRETTLAKERQMTAAAMEHSLKLFSDDMTDMFKPFTDDMTSVVKRINDLNIENSLAAAVEDAIDNFRITTYDNTRDIVEQEVNLANDSVMELMQSTKKDNKIFSMSFGSMIKQLSEIQSTNFDIKVNVGKLLQGGRLLETLEKDFSHLYVTINQSQTGLSNVARGLEALPKNADIDALGTAVVEVSGLVKRKLGDGLESMANGLEDFIEKMMQRQLVKSESDRSSIMGSVDELAAETETNMTRVLDITEDSNSHVTQILSVLVVLQDQLSGICTDMNTQRDKNQLDHTKLQDGEDTNLKLLQGLVRSLEDVGSKITETTTNTSPLNQRMAKFEEILGTLPDLLKLQAASSWAEGEISRLKADLNGHKMREDSLWTRGEEIEEKAAAVASTKAENMQLRSKVGDLERALREWEAMLGPTADKQAEQDKRLDLLMESLESGASKIENLASERDGIVLQRDEAISEFNQVTCQMKDVAIENSKALAQRDAAIAELNKANEALKEHGEVVIRLQTAVSQLAEANAKLNEAVSQRDAAIAERDEANEALKGHDEVAIRLQTAVSQRDDANSKFNQVTCQIKEVANENSKTVSQRDAAIAELNKANEALKGHDEVVRRLQRAISQRDEANAKLDEGISEKKDQSDAHKKELDRLTGERDGLSDENGRLREQLSALEREKELFHKELDEGKQAHASTLAEILRVVNNVYSGQEKDRPKLDFVTSRHAGPGTQEEEGDPGTVGLKRRRGLPGAAEQSSEDELADTLAERIKAFGFLDDDDIHNTWSTFIRLFVPMAIDQLDEEKRRCGYHAVGEGICWIARCTELGGKKRFIMGKRSTTVGTWKAEHGALARPIALLGRNNQISNLRHLRALAIANKADLQAIRSGVDDLARQHGFDRHNVPMVNRQPDTTGSHSIKEIKETSQALVEERGRFVKMKSAMETRAGSIDKDDFVARLTSLIVQLVTDKQVPTLPDGPEALAEWMAELHRKLPRSLVNDARDPLEGSQIAEIDRLGGRLLSEGDELIRLKGQLRERKDADATLDDAHAKAREEWEEKMASKEKELAAMAEKAATLQRSVEAVEKELQVACSQFKSQEESESEEATPWDAACQKQLEEAETELASHADTIQNLRRKLQRLEESSTETDARLETEKHLRESSEQREATAEASKESIVENHRVEVGKLKTELEAQRKAAHEACCKIFRLEVKITNDTIKFNYLMEKGGRESAAMAAQLETANGQTQQFGGELQEVKSELEKQRQRAVVLQNRMVSAGAETEKAKDDIQELQQSKSALEATVKSLTGDKLEASKTTEVLRADLDTERVKVGELTSSLNEIKTSYTDSERLLRKCQDELATSREVNDMLTNKMSENLRQSHEKVMERENEMEEAATALRETISSLKGKINDLKTAETNNKHKISNLETDFRGLKVTETEDKQKIRTLEGQVNDLEATVSVKRQTIQTLEARVSELQTAGAEDRQTIHVLEGRVNDLQAIKTEDRQKILALEGQASNLRAAETDKQQTIHALEGQVSILRAAETDKQQTIHALEGQVNDLQATETDKQQTIRALEGQVNGLQATKTNKQQTINELEGRYNALEDTHSITKARLSDFLREAGPGLSSAIVAGGSESTVVEYEPLLICQTWNGNAVEPDLSAQSMVSIVAAIFCVFDKPAWDDCYVGALMRRLTECLGEVSIVYPQVMRQLVERCTERIAESSLQDLAPAPDSILAEMKAHCSDAVPKLWRDVTEMAPLLEVEDESVRTWTRHRGMTLRLDNVDVIKASAWEKAIVWLRGSRRFWFVEANGVKALGYNEGLMAPTGLDQDNIILDMTRGVCWDWWVWAGWVSGDGDEVA